jgi:hypothetical protein
MAATLQWTNITGGDWNVAANWSPNQVPGPDDDVVMDVPGPLPSLILPARIP